MLDSVEELKKIASMIEVDEIHIFDTTGCIISGTHPSYYGYTFDSGDQMSFFKPMLEDQSLRLVQDITPNTAEMKMMQYSALWSHDGKFIVQVGMEPVNVLKVTEKNELSYIFPCCASILMRIIMLFLRKMEILSALRICPVLQKTVCRLD